MSSRTIAGALCALGLCSACVTVELDDRIAGEEPLSASSIEAGLWMEMEEHEQRIIHAGARVQDPELNAYISKLTCRITDTYCDDVRVYILEDPTFNALMAPNGMMIINTGLLLRAENEAELAFVLGHEFGHFLERHSLERYISWKRSAQVSAFLTAGMGDLFALASTIQFSREQEHQADEIGLRSLAGAGYDTSAAHTIWENLKAEIEASTNKKKRKRFNKLSFSDLHPLPITRIENLKQLSEEHEGGGTLHEIQYREHIRPHLADWLKIEIATRDTGATLQLIARLMAREADLGVLEYARGEVLRIRNGDGDAQAALAAYNKAAGHPDAPNDTWRQMGDTYLSMGYTKEAHTAFAEYMRRAPDAKDKALIKVIMKDLGEPIQ